MKASKGGVIINNASVVGETSSLALKGMAAYGSSKRAVIGLSEQVAADASEFGTRIFDFIFVVHDLMRMHMHGHVQAFALFV